MLAVGVNLSTLTYLWYLSALYLQFAAYVKDIFTVLIALLFTNEAINSIELQVCTKQ